MTKACSIFPIRIFIRNEGKINLIPVNYFTEAILSILEKPENETIYHITSHRPESMAQTGLIYANAF